MSTETYNLIVQLASVAIAAVAGFGGVVPLVNWLRGVLKTNGRANQLVAVVVCVLVAVATLLVQGALAPETVTGENVAGVFGAVLAASQAEYRRYKDQQNGTG